MSQKDINSLITDNLDIWTTAIKSKSRTGRGSNKTYELYGIKKLRELILDLAVRGLLVPQDPNDEPASELLKKIAAEKERLIKEGKIKKQKPLPPISEEEKPYGLLEGWEFVRLGVLLNSISSGGTPSKRNSNYWGGDIPWASVKDLSEFREISKTQDYITMEGLNNGSRLANVDDLLICTRMGLGKICKVSAPMAFNQDLKAVQLAKYINSDFFINTYATLKIKGTGTTVKGIKQEQLLEYVIGLPPYDEQVRIVSKVEELMALCDQLEQQTDGSIKGHKLLVENLLNALTQAKDHTTFQQAWQRIAEHFDTLFTTEHSIDQLKQTILQLAVMGKLVPQDPNDEPASELLKKIATEKEKLIKEGKIKKQKPLPEITEDEKPFELPEGWEWTIMGNLSSDIHYGYTASAKPENQGVRLLRITDIQNDKVNWETVPGCEIIEDKIENYLLKNDDILIARTGGTIGKSYLVESINLKAVFASYLIRVKRISAMYSPYLKIFLGSKIYWGQLYENTSGTGQPNVNATALKKLMVTIAPFNEQKRIVAKVNELMGLCDQLISQITSSNKIKSKIANTLTIQERL